MQKIGDIPNTRADNNGEFTDGNVAGGVPPTILPAEWFNTIQREMISVLTAAGITPDSKKFDQVATAVSKLITDGGFLKTTNNLSEIKSAGAVAQATARSNLGIAARFQKLTTSGSFTVPAGVTTLYISGCAGGGGGGGGSSRNSTSTAASGGGGGQSTQKSALTVTAGSVISYIIGTGGTSGAGNTAANAAAGGGGGSTTFGALLTLTGGGGGVGGVISSSASSGGAGGTGFPSGGNAISVVPAAIGAYGIAGSGASTPFGGGGSGGICAGASTSAGGDSYGYGSGGGGGGGNNIDTTGAGKNGGAGAPGVLFIEW